MSGDRFDALPGNLHSLSLPATQEELEFLSPSDKIYHAMIIGPLLVAPALMLFLLLLALGLIALHIFAYIDFRNKTYLFTAAALLVDVLLLFFVSITMFAYYISP